MNKLVLKILIAFSISFLIFMIYLGTTDFVVKPKIIESDYKVEKINLIILILFFFLGSLEANQIFDIKKSVKDMNMAILFQSLGILKKIQSFHYLFESHSKIFNHL